MYFLIDFYKKQSHNEPDSKRCVQILGEIYVIASVHPQVLETCLHQVLLLFPNPADTVRLMIERLQELQSSSSLCSSFRCEDSSTRLDEEASCPSRGEVNKKSRSFEHSLDSIEVNLNGGRLNDGLNDALIATWTKVKFKGVNNFQLHIISEPRTDTIIF